jgi:prolyl-tRNA synthetase
VARSRVAPLVDSRTELEEFATPGVVTIDGLTAPPYSVAANRQLKTLVYVADEKPIVAVVRGDHTLNEAKLQAISSAAQVRAAQADEVFDLMGAHPGSLGAVGFSASSVLVDEALAGRTSMVTGANRDGFHLSGVDVDRDVLSGEHARVADLRVASAGEGCPVCDGTLDSFAALEVGHIFKLGTRYSERLGATILDGGGNEVPLVMGSYGIGLERLLAAAVEQHHDADGIIWPMALAPFSATVLTLGAEPELASMADDVIAQLSALGVDVLFDDRDERPGVKFKDADLIGIPIRIAVGRRGLANRTVEWKLRTSPASESIAVEAVGRRAASVFE